MSVSVSRQGLELIWAAALGVGLGLLYDLGRALRRERRRLTAPVDALFALVFFLGLWLTSIYTHGLRLYQCLGVGLGAAAYFLTLSSCVVRLGRTGLQMMGRLRRRLLAPVKKAALFFQKLLKKLFSSPEKWGKIKKVSISRATSRRR